MGSKGRRAKGRKGEEMRGQNRGRTGPNPHPSIHRSPNLHSKPSPRYMDQWEKKEKKLRRPARLELSKLLMADGWRDIMPAYATMLDIVTTYKLMLEPIREFAEVQWVLGWGEGGARVGLVITSSSKSP